MDQSFGYDSLNRLTTAAGSGYNYDAAGNLLQITGAPPTPQIIVEQPASTPLVDGVSSVSFGTVSIGNSSSAFTFTIKNLGAADLSGFSVTKDGNHSSDFTINTTGMLGTVPVGTGSTSFTVTFTPTASGPRTAVLHITSNDTLRSPFDIVLSGNPPPEIAVFEGVGTGGPERQDNAGLFSFLDTTVGVTSAARTLTIKNMGPGTLTGLSLNHDGDQSADYALGSLGATSLAANETTSFTVTFTPSGEGTRRAFIHIGSSDGDENPFDVSLSGVGIAARVPTLAEQYATQANETYAYFSGRGDQRSALAYWFYFRAFSDQARYTSEGNTALANKEYYQGLAYFYYTLMEGEVGRLYYYYLYLGYAELTYRAALGDTAGANAYFTYYYTLALYFAGV